MNQSAGPFELASTPLVLAPSGDATPRPFSPDFFADLDRDFSNFSGHVLMMTFAFDTAWPTWEMHPNGDEFVYLLEGDTDLVLRTPQGESTVRVSTPGEYVVVPKGAWHTARPHAPTRMLFVTPGEGTLNEPEPPL